MSAIDTLRDLSPEDRQMRVFEDPSLIDEAVERIEVLEAKCALLSASLKKSDARCDELKTALDAIQAVRNAFGELK